MRILLRNRKTRLYCGDPSGCAAPAKKALGFTSVAHAAKFASDAKLPETEIVLSFELLATEAVVPVLRE